MSADRRMPEMLRHVRWGLLSMGFACFAALAAPLPNHSTPMAPLLLDHYPSAAPTLPSMQAGWRP